MSTFTNITKNKLSWPAPVVTEVEYFLKISDDFFLLIGDTHKLVINRGLREETDWTPTNKSR